MKSMKTILALSLLAICMPPAIYAQSSYHFTLLYTPSLPLGDVTDFSDGFTWRGVAADARFYVNDNVTVGFFTGWEVFREESDGIVSEAIDLGDLTATISAKQFRFTNSVPLLLTSHYHWGERGDARPYIGLGAGLYYITQRLEMGLYAIEDKTTRFGLAPSVGVILPMSYDTSLNLGIQYNQAFKVDDYTGVGYLSFNVGLTWGD